jgi:photosystem II stability/assembly factor-like uncharacterized protein
VLGIAIAAVGARTAAAGTPFHTWAVQQDAAGLSDVAFLDGSTGLAVGDSGTILRTANAGTTWFNQSSGTSERLAAVSFVSATTAYAVGADGTIVHSTDGGATWAVEPWDGASGGYPQVHSQDVCLNGVDFADASHGLAVGCLGGVLRYLPPRAGGADGWVFGVTPPGNALTDVDMVNTSVAYAVGIRGTIVKTADGGQHWTTVPWPARRGQILPNLWAVSMVDASTGWAVGDNGTIVRIANGGATLTLEPSGTTQALYGVHVLPGGLGTAVGAGGTIVRTPQAGSIPWYDVTPSGLGVTSDLHGFEFVPGTPIPGFAVGDSGVIMRSADAGVAWSVQIRPALTGSPLRSVAFVDALNGVAVGTHALIATSDGGATWSGGPASQVFTGVTPALGHWWETAEVENVSNPPPGAILEDGLQLQQTPARLAPLAFGGSTGLAVGDGGQLLRSFGGLSWDDVTASIPVDKLGANFSSVTIDNGVAYVLGPGGTVLRSDDFAQAQTSFASRDVPTTKSLVSGSFLSTNPDYGYVAATDALFRTVDGGSSWTQPIAVPVAASVVRFVYPSLLWIAGLGGIAETDTTSFNWTLETPTLPINDVVVNPDGTGVAVGYGGLVLKRVP